MVTTMVFTSPVVTHSCCSNAFQGICFSIWKFEKKSFRIVISLFLIPLTTRLTYQEPFISVFIFPEWFQKHGLPFSLEILPISLLYFYSGYFLNKNLKEFKPSLWGVVISFILFVFLHSYFDVYVDLNNKVFRSFIAATVAGYCGIYFALSVAFFCNLWQPISRILRYMGANSLYLLLFHDVFL